MLGTSNDVQDRPLTWPLSADARTASQRRLNGLRTALFAEMGQRVRAEHWVVVGESGGSAIAAKPANGALEVCQEGEVAVVGRQTIRCLSAVLEEPLRVGVRNELVLFA